MNLITLYIEKNKKTSIVMRAFVKGKEIPELEMELSDFTIPSVLIRSSQPFDPFPNF